MFAVQLYLADTLPHILLQGKPIVLKYVKFQNVRRYVKSLCFGELHIYLLLFALY